MKYALIAVLLIAGVCGCRVGKVGQIISGQRQTQVQVTWWSDDAISFRYTDEDGAKYCGAVVSGLPEGVYANGPGLPLHGRYFSGVYEARRAVERDCLVSSQEQAFIEDQITIHKIIVGEKP